MHHTQPAKLCWKSLYNCGIMNHIILDTQSECVFRLKPQQHVEYSIILQTDWKFSTILSLLLAWAYTHLSSIHKLCYKSLWWFYSLLTFLFKMKNLKITVHHLLLKIVESMRGILSAAGMFLRNAVSSLQIFGSTNDSKCPNISGDIRIYIGEIRHTNFKKHH